MRCGVSLLLLLQQSVPAVANLDELAYRLVNTYTANLEIDPQQHNYELHHPEPEAQANWNRMTRQVTSGHYCRVWPTPLPEPYLVSYSSDMLLALGVNEDEASTDRFVRFFAGETHAVGHGFGGGWATPYALSVYGSPMIPGDSGVKGDGYGDGRAISIGEVEGITGGSRWEIQLKGAGKTPFSRFHDGRAVLRSSVREFIAQEAMHALGVPTTRSVALVASKSERVLRAWYKNASSAISAGTHNPDEFISGDHMEEEPCAISTRASRSFIRVGQFELYGRRARDGNQTALRQLEMLARHTLEREYPEQVNPKPLAPLQPQLLGMLLEAAARFSKLVTHWLRVGYVQSNFNSDNCLVGGRTMDYGPFGFVERYDPDWGMWIGTGDHFAFMNQPRAMRANLKMWSLSLVPLLDEQGIEALEGVDAAYQRFVERDLDEMWASKLGFPHASNHSKGAWYFLERLLKAHPTDYTIFWRQMAEVMSTIDASHQTNGKGQLAIKELLHVLAPAFYTPLPPEGEGAYLQFLAQWVLALQKVEEKANRCCSGAATEMRTVSPKYVPREWMLASAYRAAEAGDFGPLHELLALLRQPYADQPAMAGRFYKRGRLEDEQQGGIGFMS